MKRKKVQHLTLEQRADATLKRSTLGRYLVKLLLELSLGRLEFGAVVVEQFVLELEAVLGPPAA